jgi:hypothetical protein
MRGEGETPSLLPSSRNAPKPDCGFRVGWTSGITYNVDVVTLSAHFDGKVIVPDEPIALAAGAHLRVTVEPMDQPAVAVPGKLDLPLLTGVDPQVVLAVMADHEFDIENAKAQQFVRPPAGEKPR